jgi:hypothetical protein
VNWFILKIFKRNKTALNRSYFILSLPDLSHQVYNLSPFRYSLGSMKVKNGILYIVISGLYLIFLFSCKKEPNYTAPTVVISPVTMITTNGAESGGDVISEGSGAVTLKGVCWSTSQNPTTIGNKTTNGSGTGSYTSTMTGLLPGKTYYVRAYAINPYGTGYSSQSSFTTLATIPTLTTLALSGVSPTSANGGGNISSDGGASITVRGICWSTNLNPTIADNKTNDGTGSGNFTSVLSGLNAGLIYYVRAYATNIEGTAYGNQVVAITSSVSPVITDGSFVVIQKSSIGRGIDIVFMGDGYTPQNILAGNYENNIRQAFTSYFNIEPYTTYSAYFNVYMVYAFSNESGISDLTRTISTRFETKYDGATTSSEMSANTNTCTLYALKAPVIDIDNTVAVVIANSTRYGGTTYIHSGLKGINISICPVNPTYFSNIVQHEAGGHGFGNFADEYVNNTGLIPQAQANIIITGHNNGILLNVDLTNDPTKILWNHFFGLANYTYVSAYQGGFLYALGVWRPEDNSLMKNNIRYINAPGREAIVKRIMSLAGFTYSFADFQAKDVMQLTATTKSAALLFDNSLQLAPPVFMK